MFRLGLSAILCLVLAASAGAQTRIAVVRFEDVTSQLPSYLAIRTWMDGEIKAIANDKRSGDLRKLSEEFRQQFQTARNLPKDSSAETRGETTEKLKNLQAEAAAIQKDLGEFQDREKKRILEQAVKEAERIEAHIQATAARLAKERGFDLLFDASAVSNSTVPVLLYVKKTNDLTDDVLAALLSEEEEIEAEAEAEAEAGADVPETEDDAPAAEAAPETPAAQ